MAARHYDVIVLGAGPSGAIASALLARKGWDVLVLEKQSFPRFSIGESLLPQCMEYIEEAGMLEAVQAAGFQKKSGAMFQRRGVYSGFDFGEKFSGDWGYTFQVPRAGFDKILADEAAVAGADVRYLHEVLAVRPDASQTTVSCKSADDARVHFSCNFLMDASGFGRVLPRLLGLELPSDFPVRFSLFTHIEDQIDPAKFDRNKILISIHPQNQGVWYWLIPFSNGRCSIGVVGEPEFFDGARESVENLQSIVHQDPILGGLLRDASWDTPVKMIKGYSSNVKHLCTERYALLGNAGEFLDPVFSSGVTIAMRSASMAAAVVDRQLCGEKVDWQKEYAMPLTRGIDTFRAFVTAWYDSRLQDIIFQPRQSKGVREMICSILGGYAWDETNPFVSQPERRLHTLWKICQA